jgi:hypothetical protein
MLNMGIFANFESILEAWVDPRPHDSGELAVLRKADWTRVFGGLKLRPLSLLVSSVYVLEQECKAERPQHT